MADDKRTSAQLSYQAYMAVVKEKLAQSGVDAIAYGEGMRKPNRAQRMGEHYHGGSTVDEAAQWLWMNL